MLFFSTFSLLRVVNEDMGIEKSKVLFLVSS